MALEVPEPQVTADIVTEFLRRLEECKPELGYLHIEDGPRIEADDSTRASVGIDGWVYREDMERVLWSVFADARREALGEARAIAQTRVEVFGGDQRSSAAAGIVALIDDLIREAVER